MPLFSSSQKILDLEARLAALTSAVVATGFYTVAEPEKGKTELTLTEAGTAALGQGALLVEAENTNLTLSRRVTAFEAAVGTDGHFTFGADAARPVIALTDAGRAAFINAGITTTVAAAGHTALPIAAASAAVDTSKQATALKLTGRERLKAETRKEFASKTAPTITV